MLDNDVMWYWLTAALVLGVVECFVEGFVALGLAAACLVFGVLSNVPVLYQNMAAAHFVAAAAVIVVVFFIFGNRIFWRERHGGIVSRLGVNAKDKIIGQAAVLKEPIVAGRGTVSVNGTLWKCFGEDLPAGTQVVVADLSGNSLLVKRLGDG
jgi:membrane protein implicated in regulation of membrane protease activity